MFLLYYNLLEAFFCETDKGRQYKPVMYVVGAMTFFTMRRWSACLSDSTFNLNLFSRYLK